MPPSAAKEETVVILKDKKQYGNVYEKKGSSWRMGRVSGNVTESTYT
jgi:hypothetical protein